MASQSQQENALPEGVEELTDDQLTGVTGGASAGSVYATTGSNSASKNVGGTPDVTVSSRTTPDTSTTAVKVGSTYTQGSNTVKSSG